MYTAEHIAALISIITEQRERITKIEAELAESKEIAERNWRWYSEEEKKSHSLAEQLNQPRA